MLYLLDANVLIDANRDYYPVERIPEFWEWLVHKGEAAEVKIPIEIYEEIKDGNDELASWINTSSVKEALIYESESDPDLVNKVVEIGYANDITDDEIIKIGRDPFLISYGLVNPTEICIVTTEVSKPSRRRANTHVPDAAIKVGVETCNSFEFLRRLDFRTSWQ